MLTLSDRIAKERVWMLRQPALAAYARLLMGLPDKFGFPIPTACTDGTCIKWGNDWAETLTPEEIRFVLLHEGLHVWLKHFLRFKPGGRANQACDYVINMIITHEIAMPGCLKMPKGGLLDYSYKNMYEEQVYALLDSQDSLGGGDGNGGGSSDGGGSEDSCGGFEPLPEVEGQTAEEKEAAKAQALKSLESSIRAVVGLAKATGGHIPACVQSSYDAMTVKPKPDWKAVTSEFLKNVQSHKKDWSRCAKRHAWRDILVPARKQNDPGPVVIVRDTSGSCWSEQGEFAAILNDARRELGFDVYLIDADDIIAAEQWLAAGDPFPAMAAGGGGTDFRPAINRVHEMMEEHNWAGIIYITDLWGSEPEVVHLPILWLCTTDNIAKTGSTVRI